ncbi:MAG TPA: VOC family protein, partial [Xanthobacteraceae bacterium]|nr:VOC family protein [Xanthobacteraceae bacterium]
MMQTLVHIALIIRDYDEAIDYYTRVMGFELLEDSPREPGKRWVLVAPRGNRGSSLLLARAANTEQQSRIGNQTGGRVFLFLHTDDFRRDHEALQANGVHFIES